MRSARTPTEIRPPSRAPRSAHGHRNAPAALLALIGVPLLLAGTALTLDTSQVVASASAAAPRLTAVDGFPTSSRTATAAIVHADAVLADARATLTDSAGRVLDEEARTVLAESIRSTTASVRRAEKVVDRAALQADPLRSGGRFFSPPDLARATQTLQRMPLTNGADLAEVADALDGTADAVTAAVASWQAEQERLAAEEAARVEAARVEAARVEAAEAERVAAAAAASAQESQAAQAAQAAQGGGTADPGDDGAPAGPASVDKYVWTSGFQTEIDACNGAVDVTGNYGVAVIAEHWSCGGAWFPGSGTVITLSGVRSGTYLVGGVAAVLNANTQGIGDVPRGYDLLYQTCIDGSNTTMSFTVLTRIG
ncbi:hypothetical protein BJQ94_01790 [Cryobacterium sp. SO2]|uniref:hypothetical protein n=1 Tax=Cryobacterium sp. SO2 TaxID=1897060 RepID=UPI00223CFB7E|nr:hypothetical protein [Cryobacterium sp. SO2]WEO77805.1 hypothetical protein BJQ94_01790 [Cryobacterium sp. SO2]